MIKLICCSHEKCKTSFKPKASVKKMDRVIRCNRKDWLKPYIDTNRNLRKKKSDFEKNHGKHTDIKLVTTEK